MRVGKLFQNSWKRISDSGFLSSSKNRQNQKLKLQRYFKKNDRAKRILWWNYRFYFLHGPDGSTIPIDFDLVHDLLNDVDNTEDYNFEDKKIPEKKFGTNLFQVNQRKQILISVN